MQIKQRTKDVVVVIDVEALLAFLDRFLPSKLVITDLRQLQRAYIYKSIVWILSCDLGYCLVNNISKAVSTIDSTIDKSIRDNIYLNILDAISAINAISANTTYYIEVFLVNENAHIIFSR